MGGREEREEGEGCVRGCEEEGGREGGREGGGGLWGLWVGGGGGEGACGSLWELCVEREGWGGGSVGGYVCAWLWGGRRGVRGRGEGAVGRRSWFKGSRVLGSGVSQHESHQRIVSVPPTAFLSNCVSHVGF